MARNDPFHRFGQWQDDDIMETTDEHPSPTTLEWHSTAPASAAAAEIIMKKRRTAIRSTRSSDGDDGDEDDDGSGKRQRRCGTTAIGGPWGCLQQQQQQQQQVLPQVCTQEEDDDSSHLVEQCMDLSDDAEQLGRRRQDRIRQLQLSSNNNGNGNGGTCSLLSIIHQQIIDQFAKGSGGLLREDRHLLEDHIMEEVLHHGHQVVDVDDQIDWLELVVHARNRAKAWDASQYTRERNVLQNWLR